MEEDRVSAIGGDAVTRRASQGSWAGSRPRIGTIKGGKGSVILTAVGEEAVLTALARAARRPDFPEMRRMIPGSFETGRMRAKLRCSPASQNRHPQPGRPDPTASHFSYRRNARSRYAANTRRPAVEVLEEHETEDVFFTGGVVSSVGKGVPMPPGLVLKQRGFNVAAQKFDPYINVDPGTMSPYSMAEVPCPG